MTNIPSVEIRNLSVTYDIGADRLNAVRDLSLTLARGEILGIVGESGSGKTTVASAILGLLQPDVSTGAACVNGINMVTATRSELMDLRRHYMAAILQDPLGSLNPVRKIRSQLFESQAAAANSRRDLTAINEVLMGVGLDSSRVLDKYPHELSGGMNQRIAIAMALLKNPNLLVTDEPTSALDVRTQAAIIRLLLKIRDERGASILIITHDLELALGSCDRVAVMYAGRLVEIGKPSTLGESASHPYTRALLATSPKFGVRTRVEPIPGRFRVVLNDEQGCPFLSRCKNADAQCQTFPEPTIREGSTFWCWHPVGNEQEKNSRRSG